MADDTSNDVHAAATPAPPVSIMILTLNEEMNLPGCLESVTEFDDVVVVDSFSTDGTQRVTEEFGRRFIPHAFEGWAQQQNWAMANIDWKHRWIFYLDADERMTPELRAEISRIAADPNHDKVAYYCGRRNLFRGRWIRHAMPPGFIMRFFRPDKIRFERTVNPIPVFDGPHGYLGQTFIHHNFSKGLHDWFERHNRYSLKEAEMLHEEIRSNPVGFKDLFDKDKARARFAAKVLSFRVPLREVCLFLYWYVAKRGFLDGKPGLIYCIIRSMYEFQISLKMEEIRRREKGLVAS